MNSSAVTKNLLPDSRAQSYIMATFFLALCGVWMACSPNDAGASTAAEECFIAKDGFGVLQPYMVTKGCFLFHHGANVDLRHQSEMVITRKEELHPDPIHAEFLRFVLDKKLITLKKGTPIFSCDYDLGTVARDFKLSGDRGGATRTLGYELPSFNCAGTTSMWVPIRPIHEARCYWVATSLVHCKDFSEDLDPMSATGDSDKDE